MHTLARRASIEGLEPRRMMDAGDFDRAFGQQGQVTLPEQATDIQRIFELADGRLLLTGEQFDEPFLKRLKPNGQVDSTFPNPTVLKTLQNTIDDQFDYALDSDQRLIIAGEAGPKKSGSIADHSRVELRRLTSSGKIDKHFGSGGVATVRFLELTAIGVLPDGRIVVSGVTKANTDFDSNDVRSRALAVLKPNGQLDSTFGTKGIVSTGSTTDIVDALEIDIRTVQAEQFFPLSGGRLLYVRRIDTDSTFFDDLGGTDFTESISSSPQAMVLNSAGTTDLSFVFDRTDVLGSGWIMNGGVQSANGSVKLVLVRDETPPGAGDDDPRVYNAFNVVLATDGTATTSPLVQNVTEPRLFSLRDPATGDVFLATSQHTLARIHSDSSQEATFPTEPALSDDSATVETGVLTDDGQFVGSFQISIPGTSETHVAKLQTGEAPTGVLSASPLRLGRSTSYRFSVTWQDDETVAVASLATRHILIIDPDGGQRYARPVQTQPTSDTSIIKATYKLTPPGGTWDSADNGTYRVRLKNGRVSDTGGHFAGGRILGLLRVEIPLVSAKAQAMPFPSLGVAITHVKKPDSATLIDLLL